MPIIIKFAVVYKEYNRKLFNKPDIYAESLLLITACTTQYTLLPSEEKGEKDNTKKK